jgi:hypothetical protein
LSLLQTIRESLAQVFKESAECRQPLVPRLNGVSSIFFERVQEAEDRLGVQTSSSSWVIFLCVALAANCKNNRIASA